MLLGVIADDFTGASDVGNTLAKGGMATTQFVGVPRTPAPVACEAGVVSLKSRTIPVREAIAQSVEALDWLLAQGCRQILFKYCSTFDSTPEGNIGPVAEALLDKLGGIAVVCPVFPATGRRHFNGHLFVGDRLLSETGMRTHPLTPMTDPEIRRWLAAQCSADVGLVPYPVVRQGATAIHNALKSAGANGQRLIVVDAIVDDDLMAIGEAIADHALVTGGSGIAIGLPANFRRKGMLSATSARFQGMSGPAVCLSGSCSTQSLAQIVAFSSTHPTLAINPDAVMDGSMRVEHALAWAMERLAALPMVYASANPESVEAAQRQHGREAVAHALESFMGHLAIQLTDAGVERLVVGGGETSGAVVTALGIDALAIGPEIDPGVPALSADCRALALALKSGNFGDLDFYEKAAAVLGNGA